MQIQKFLHSCLCLIEGNQRLLIDPGSFSFIEGKLRPEDLPLADIILLTHEHPDHYYPDALKIITATRKPIIITNENLALLLRNQSLAANVIRAGESIKQGAFTIQGIKAPHGDLPVSKPDNIGFLINGMLFHPGDSLKFSLPKPPKVLALPVTAPWLTLQQAIETALRAKAESVIPIHDAICKDFMLERIYAMCKQVLGIHGITFRPLELGELLEIQ